MHAFVQYILEKHRAWIVLAIVALLVAGVFLYAYQRITALSDRVTSLSENLASTTGALSKSLSELNSQTEGISQTLSSTTQDVAHATENISAVQNQVGGVEQKIGSISGTVSTLKKLSTIDPELLKKYSKVYFLNENYAPAHLSKISQDEVYSNSREEDFLTEAIPFLQNLLSAAKADNVTFYIESA